jgi:hypothetical protein
MQRYADVEGEPNHWGGHDVGAERSARRPSGSFVAAGDELEEQVGGLGLGLTGGRTGAPAQSGTTQARHPERCVAMRSPRAGRTV